MNTKIKKIIKWLIIIIIAVLIIWVVIPVLMYNSTIDKTKIKACCNNAGGIMENGACSIQDGAYAACMAE